MSAYTTQPLPHRRKRVRFTSSEPSNSDESALVPTSTTSLSTDASDLSETDSELSSSSEEPSDESSEESSDEDGDTEMELDDTSTTTTTATPTTDAAQTHDGGGVTNLIAHRGTKPAFKFDTTELGPDIRSFLKDFLPQLKAANEELEAQKRAGTLKSLDAGPEGEGEPYIEMDLGLGVLEAKGLDGSDSEESEDSGGEERGEGVEKDVLGKLLGRGKK
ncbi:hypothetical protein T440DRAFT_350310, partial [Plenodomus tracheiphilus IPT5]